MSTGRPLRVPPSDDVVDHVIRRGRTAGGCWIVASVAAFGVGTVLGSPVGVAIALAAGAASFSVGMLVRRRYWQRARADVGEEALLRGRWRSADREFADHRLLLAAVLIPVLVVGYRLWTG